MDTNAFYGTVSGLSFTLLGLWWVACQARSGWLERTGGQAMAYVVSLHFLIPGTMSLLAMVAPDEPLIWRGVFAIAGVLGVLSVVLISRQMAPVTRAARQARILAWVGVPVYAITALVAVAPQLVETVGLSALILLGVQAAWLLTFGPATPDDGTLAD
jgi:uncharacterized membrane protein